MARTREVGSLAIGLVVVLCAGIGCAHGDRTAAELREAEDPNSVLNKDRPALDRVDEQKHDQQLRAAESENPDSIDSRLPSAASVLQRLEAFNRGERQRGQLAEQRGGARVSSFGAQLVQESSTLEAELRPLAEKLSVDLDDLSDRRAIDQATNDQETAARLQDIQAAQFDLRFAQQTQRDERRALDALTSLRARCVEPRVCALIARMIPVLNGDQSAAGSLVAALGQNASTP